MTTVSKQVNGIDVEQLKQTIGAIEERPELSRFTFRAKSAWTGGTRSRTTVQGFYGAGQEDDSRARPLEMEGDEPPVLLGTNAAPNAVEAILHALASCLSVGFVVNAAARGIEVESLDFDLEGELDLQSFLGLSHDARPGYAGIDVRYRVKADAPREQIEELCSYVQRTSPVMDVLTNPVPVRVRLEG